MKSNQWQKIVFALSVTALPLFLFQNCSKANFAGTKDSDVTKTSSEQVEYRLKHTPGQSFPNVDILFVVDESSSMGKVLENIQAGFASLGQASYPPNTKIAFTNMAPAIVNDNGVIDYTDAFHEHDATPQHPGFMQLVDGQSIQRFLDSPSVGNGLKNHFQQPGCQAWFAPQEKNSNNVSCISAASQIILLGTGVEAGTATLFQLAKKYSANSEKLFRDGALVNVVFVSDTHDAGAGYYGRNRAFEQMVSVENLKAEIQANNPLIADIKFNGILPLPSPNGDDKDKLEGLNVLNESDLPASTEELLASTNERLWDFSYLEFIKSTGGSALHFLSADWDSAMESMITSIGKTNKAILQLEGECKTMIQIQMDGTNLTADQYAVVDSKTIRIEIENLSVQEYTFDLICEN